MQLSTNQNLILIEGAATYERVLAEMREVEIDEGIRHLEDFLKIYPDFACAHNDIAVLYHQTGGTLKALAHYEKAHKLEPANTTYRKNLADFYFVELQWAREAIHTYLDILKDNPFDTEALNALGTMSLDIGRKEQARQYFTRTLQIDAGNLQAQQGLQEIPAALPEPPLRHTTAVSATGHAAGIAVVSPPQVPSFQNLFTITPAASPVKSEEELYCDAAAQADEGKLSDAVSTLESLLKLCPEHALAHNDVAVLYQRSGRMEDALRHHREAARLQPSNPLFQKNLADILCCEFDCLEEALEIYVKLFSGNRYDIETIKAIASICMAVGKPDDARYFIDHALSIKPWDQEAAEMLREL